MGCDSEILESKLEERENDVWAQKQKKKVW